MKESDALEVTQRVESVRFIVYVVPVTRRA
jgi:hypothetical protein